MNTHLISQCLWVWSLDTAYLGPLVLPHKVAVRVLTGLFPSGGLTKEDAACKLTHCQQETYPCGCKSEGPTLCDCHLEDAPGPRGCPQVLVTGLLQITTHFLKLARGVSLPTRECPGPL